MSALKNQHSIKIMNNICESDFPRDSRPTYSKGADRGLCRGTYQVSCKKLVSMAITTFYVCTYIVREMSVSHLLDGGTLRHNAAAVDIIISAFLFILITKPSVMEVVEFHSKVSFINSEMPTLLNQSF